MNSQNINLTSQHSEITAAHILTHSKSVKEANLAEVNGVEGVTFRVKLETAKRKEKKSSKCLQSGLLREHWDWLVGAGACVREKKDL